MTIVQLVIVGLVMGIVFGVALEKSRVFEPGVIVAQFQLRNFIMLKVFLTAVATGLLVLAVMTELGLATLSPKATVYGANIVGGLLLGAGIALSGACPGTVLAQVGAGYKDAWAVLAGGIVGAGAYGYLEPLIGPFGSGGPGKLTLASITGVPFWVLAVVSALIIVAVLVALEIRKGWRDEIGPDHDGLASRGR